MKNIHGGILECHVGAIIFDEDFYVAIIIKPNDQKFFFLHSELFSSLSEGTNQIRLSIFLRIGRNQKTL
jgi:hypothetical protein